VITPAEHKTVQARILVYKPLWIGISSTDARLCALVLTEKIHSSSPQRSQGPSFHRQGREAAGLDPEFIRRLEEG
jgi:hypothetical protein